MAHPPAVRDQWALELLRAEVLEVERVRPLPLVRRRPRVVAQRLLEDGLGLLRATLLDQPARQPLAATRRVLELELAHAHDDRGVGGLVEVVEAVLEQRHGDLVGHDAPGVVALLVRDLREDPQRLPVEALLRGGLVAVDAGHPAARGVRHQRSRDHGPVLVRGQRRKRARERLEEAERLGALVDPIDQVSAHGAGLVHPDHELEVGQQTHVDHPHEQAVDGLDHAHGLAPVPGLPLDVEEVTQSVQVVHPNSPARWAVMRPCLGSRIHRDPILFFMFCQPHPSRRACRQAGRAGQVYKIKKTPYLGVFSIDKVLFSKPTPFQSTFFCTPRNPRSSHFGPDYSLSMTMHRARRLLKIL